LLIASQYTFRWNGRELFEGGTAIAPPEPDNDPTPPAPPTVTQDLPEAANEEFGLTAEEAAEPYVDSDLEKEPAESLHTTTESNADTESARYEMIREQDASQDWHQAKKAWKIDHPDDTLKKEKERFIKGEIDRLPWEDYYQDSDLQKKRSYIMNQHSQQILKNRDPGQP